MNSKREVLAASLLAIGLAVGLGTLSYGFFSEVPTSKTTLDVYTQKGGIGLNVSDGDFEPFDTVTAYAYLSRADLKLADRAITFTIQTPNGTQVVRTAMTNDQGLAEIDLLLLPSEGPIIGSWNVLANATTEASTDTLGFQCRSVNAQVTLSSERNGVSSTSFLPSETVFLEANATYKNASIAGTPLTFEIAAPNGTQFLLKTVTSDSAGTANATFQIPWPSDSSLGIWEATVTSQPFGQTAKAIVHFDCELVPFSMDVYTQKGGIGTDPAGGNFTPPEVVDLFAEVKTDLNQPIPNQLITFTIIYNQSIIMAPGLETNSSGIASTSIGASTGTGTYTVIVKTSYNNVILVDTLTFEVTP